VIREVMLPFFIGLLDFTFILIIPSMMQYAEAFIAKGRADDDRVYARWQRCCLRRSHCRFRSALLVGLLIAFGRLFGGSRVRRDAGVRRPALRGC
jgi:hypothetical protein